MTEQVIAVIGPDLESSLVEDLKVICFPLFNFKCDYLNSILFLSFQKKNIEYKVSKNGEVFDEEDGYRHLYIMKEFDGDYFQNLKLQKKFIYGITTLRKMIDSIENMVI